MQLPVISVQYSLFWKINCSQNLNIQIKSFLIDYLISIFQAMVFCRRSETSRKEAAGLFVKAVEWRGRASQVTERGGVSLGFTIS